MLIYLIIFSVIIVAGILFNVDKNEKRKKVFIIISFGLMGLIAALRKYTVGTDLTYLYVKKFYDIAILSFTQLSKVNMEYGYVVLNKILSLIWNNIQILIIFTSIFIYYIYGRFILKNSNNVFFSTSLFILLNLYFMSMNIIRQQIAVAIILVGYEFLKKNRYISFIIFVFIASLFHQSALICLVYIAFYNRKFTIKSIVIGIMILAISLFFYKDFINIFTNLQNFLGLNVNKDYNMYITSQKYGVGIINLNSISSIVLSSAIFLFCLYYMKIVKFEGKTEIEEKNNNFYLYMTLIYTIISINSMNMVIIGRLQYYFFPFVLIILPKAFKYITNKFNKKIFEGLLFIPIIAKFIYIFFFLAGTLYGVMPYEFFWM